jgi:hypothetical protein
MWWMAKGIVKREEVTAWATSVEKTSQRETGMVKGKPTA